MKASWVLLLYSRERGGKAVELNEYPTCKEAEKARDALGPDAKNYGIVKVMR